MVKIAERDGSTVSGFGEGLVEGRYERFQPVRILCRLGLFCPFSLLLG